MIMLRLHRNIDKSQSSTLSTSFSSGSICGNGGHVFDSADFDTVTSDGSQSWLGTRSWGFVTCSSSTSESDVDSSDLQLFKPVHDVNSSQHGSIGGWLVSVRLNLHTSSDSSKGFSASKISDVDEGVIPSGQDVAHCEQITWAILGTQLNGLLCIFSSFFSSCCFLSLGGLGSCGRGLLGRLNLCHILVINNKLLF